MYALTSMFVVLGIFLLAYAFMSVTYITELRDTGIPRRRYLVLSVSTLIAAVLGLTLPVIGLSVAFGL